MGKRLPVLLFGWGRIKAQWEFSTGRKLQTQLYREISQSAFIDLFDIDFPWYVSDSHLELFGAVLKESKKEFLNQFPEGRFLVVIAPNSKLSPRIQTALKEQNIECLDLSSLLDKEEKRYKLHWTEAHPNHRYYLQVTQEIDLYLKSQTVN